MKRVVGLLMIIFSTISLSEEKKDLKFKIQNHNLNDVTIFVQGSDENKKVERYVIKKGDTLSEIALVYKTTIKKLAAVNNIKNVDLIYPNAVLIIN